METWKDIKGYEDIYVISDLGRVASLNRVSTDKNGRRVFHEGKMLTPQLNSRGYLRVQLKLNGTSRYHFVHRLVAQHFVINPMPEKYSVVNHLDATI